MQTGTNLVRVKDYNQGVVLQAIRASGGVSRGEIARETGLTAQTVSNIVGRLLALGLVVEAGKERASSGKPRTTVRTNPSAGYALGARIGRTETVVVLVDLDGAVVARTEHPTRQEDGPSGIVARVAREADRLVRDAAAAPKKVLGLGVACPGPLDHESGTVHRPPNFAGWDEVPLKAMLAGATGYAVMLDNNAKAAATWERWAGNARGISDFAFVYMGTGVGAGIYLDGHLHRGATSSFGAFGHTTLDPEGPLCPCGNRGCLELYCAAPTVVERVEQALGAETGNGLATTVRQESAGLTFDVIGRMAQDGDALALRELKRSAEMLGHGVVNLVNVLDVGLIVLGGKAFDRAGGLYRSEIQRSVDERAYAHDRRRVQVRLSAAADDVAAIGAATLVLHSAFAPRLPRLVPTADR